MDIAALVASGLGVAITLWAALSARRSAVEARRSADAGERGAQAAESSATTAREAEHRARTPQLSATIEPTPWQGGQWFRLRNNGPAHLDRLIVELVPTQYVHEPSVVSGFSFGGSEPSQRLALGHLALGESVDLEIARTGPITGVTVRVRCECEAGGERWVVLREVAIPPRAA